MAGRPDDNVAQVHVEPVMPLFLQLVSKQAGIGLLLTQLFTCIAAMSLPNHISRTICGITNAGGGGGGGGGGVGGGRRPGGGLEQCPSTAGLAAIAGTRPPQVPSPYQVFICLFNSKKLEKVMLHKGDNPRLAASQTQVNAIKAYSLAC